MGAACIAAASAGIVLRPRRALALLGPAPLTDVVPATFGPWRSRDIDDPLALNTPGTLAGRLYNQEVARLYTRASGDTVAALFAYGERQTDELQLHRPEVCYPAFGYQITRNEPVRIALPGGSGIPARRLLAEAEGRRECIIYWTRVGEELPTSQGEQRWAHFRATSHGVINDGLLARFSMRDVEPDFGWSLIERFAADLVVATKPGRRAALIGPALARAEAAARLRT